ncbi:MAG: histidine phosphatase family protein [Patescibacteria group bacterium]
MKLFIVRHGQTNENAKKIMMGHLDRDLSEIGVKQADKLAERLKNEKIDFIYCSDLKRTKNTLLPVLKYHMAPVIYDPILREKKQAIFEGRPAQEYYSERERIQNKHWRPEGGENFYDIKRRVRKFVQYLEANHKQDDNILIITHGGWKNVFMSYLLRIPRETVFLIEFKNTSLSEIELRPDGKHKVEVINCTKHLR